LLKSRYLIALEQRRFASRTASLEYTRKTARIHCPGLPGNGLDATGCFGCEYTRKTGRMRFKNLLFVLCSLSSIPALAAKNNTTASGNPASPEEVCAYITDQMRQAVPQNITLCSGKPESLPGYYDVKIFSPTNVLEGNLRRPWASALFQILDGIGSACSKTKCVVSVSDSYMAQRHWRLQAVVYEDTLRNQSGFQQFSEEWYLLWWVRFLSGKESDLTTDKESAMRHATYACESYLRAVRKLESLNSGKSPTCSVMLATDSTIYLLIDFADFWSPSLANYRTELPSTIGSAFEETGFDGQVILRSPWDEGKNGLERVYWTYPIRYLSLANDEEKSGSPTDGDMWNLLMRFMTIGQANKNSLHNDTDEKFLLREVAVVRYSPGTNHNVTVDTTDGAEWSLSQTVFDRCALREGTELEVRTFDGPPTITARAAHGQCLTEKVAFLGAW
jgi:hypothetical protein